MGESRERNQGCGTQKKVNLSGAVESVGGKTLANRATNSIGTMLF